MDYYTATITYKDGTTETITIMAEDLENADFIIGSMVAFNPNFQDYEIDLSDDLGENIWLKRNVVTADTYKGKTGNTIGVQ